jgi:uncharacterized protein YjiS (DUF1127 family)
MSTIFRAAPSLPISLPVRFGAQPQGNSWLDALLPVWRLVRLWAQRRWQRIALRDLADMPHLLADLGLTRAQALREADEPFWRT